MRDRESHFLRHYRRHENDIRAVIGSMVRDPQARQDILQDVALVLWKKFDEYDGVHSFGAWARGIAVRKVLQSFARARRVPVPVAPDVIESVIAAYDETEPGETEPSERQEALRRCLERLPDASRRLIELRYGKSLKLREVAERVGSTLDAAHKALSRIRDRLRDCVQKETAHGKR